MSLEDENAKNPKWKVPMEQSGVKPENYSSDIDSANGSADNNLPGSAVRSDQSGVQGFPPSLGGHAKAGHSNTSSFGKDLPTNLTKNGDSEPGQEEGGRTRQPTTSSVGRILDKDKTSN